MGKITCEMASGFFKDLLGVTHTSGNDGVMSTSMIAEYLGIGDNEAEMYLRACVKYHITEKQDGRWVV